MLHQRSSKRCKLSLTKLDVADLSLRKSIPNREIGIFMFSWEVYEWFYYKLAQGLMDTSTYIHFVEFERKKKEATHLLLGDLHSENVVKGTLALFEAIIHFQHPVFSSSAMILFLFCLLSRASHILWKFVQGLFYHL